MQITRYNTIGFILCLPLFVPIVLMNPMYLTDFWVLMIAFFLYLIGQFYWVFNTEYDMEDVGGWLD